MLTPEQLDHVSDRIVALYQQLETDIIMDMARRVGQGEYAQSSLDWQQYVYTSIDGNQKEMIQKIARINRLSEKEVEDVFWRAGIQSTGFDNTMFEQAYAKGLLDKPPVPLVKSPILQKILETGIEQTNGTLENFTRSIAANTNVQLRTALDQAYMQVSTNAFSYDVAIKQAVKRLSAQGVGKIEYPSGRKHNLDVVVRRAVLGGINITCGRMTEQQGIELGATTVETTAHQGARNTGTGYENHESWQGKWYSFKGRNPKYPDFEEKCGYGKGGGILGWGCRHSFTFVFPGSVPAYHPDDYKMEDVTYKGEKISYYDATQEQRKIERNIRHWKRQSQALQSAGQDNTFESAKVKEWQGKMRSFLKETGLKRDSKREQIHPTILPLKSKFDNDMIGEEKGTPSPNVSVAEQWAKEHLGIHADYGEFPTEVADSVNHELDKAQQLFEKQKPEITDVRPLPKDIPDYEHTGGGYLPSRKTLYYKVETTDVLKEWDAGAKHNFSLYEWSTNSTYHTIRHEIGHSVLNHSSANKDLYDEISTRFMGYKEFLSRTEQGQELSIQGFYSTDEFIAECIAEYLNGDPRKVAKDIVELILGWE